MAADLSSDPPPPQPRDDRLRLGARLWRAARPGGNPQAAAHDEPSEDAKHLFRRCGPIWLTFAAAHAVAAARDQPQDWWALAWLRGTEIATDLVWSASPAVSRPGAKLGLRLAGAFNLAAALGFAKLAGFAPSVGRQPTIATHGRLRSRIRRARPGPVRRAGLAHGRGADARLHERRVAAAARARPARCTSSAARGRSCGTRARPPATRRRSRRSATTATATRCWRWSSRPGRPATRASGPAFTAASSSPRRRTRRCRRSSGRSPSAPRASRGLLHRALLADPGLHRREGPGGGRGGGARGARGIRRARRRGGRRRALPPRRAAASRGLSLADAERVLDGRRAALSGRRADALARGGPRARARPQPDPAPRDVHRRLPDAGLGVPEAARAKGPRFLLESADQGRVGRYSFIGFRPRKVLRWSLGDPGDPVRARRGRARPLPRRAARRTCRRSPAARSGCSPTTSCARSSRSASPTPIRSASPTWR